MDDVEIIELFFKRSEQGIAELDRKYGGLCRSLSYNILNDRLDAEECVNDAYLGAWNAIPPARPEVLLPYVARIVRNVSLKAYWRREAAKRSGRYTVALEELEGCVADGHSLEDEIGAKELARIIGRFLDGLSPREPGNLHAPLLVCRQLPGHCRADRPFREKCLRAPKPYAC